MKSNALFSCKPCFPKRPECRSSTCLSDCSKSRSVHYLQKVSVEPGQNFPYFRRQCVLRVSLEVALSQQSTSQICQSNLCQRWTRWSQESLPCSGPSLPVSADTHLEEQRTNLSGPKPCPQCRELMFSANSAILFVLIATTSDLICEPSKGTQESPGQETCRDVLASV